MTGRRLIVFPDGRTLKTTMTVTRGAEATLGNQGGTINNRCVSENPPVSREHLFEGDFYHSASPLKSGTSCPASSLFADRSPETP